MSGHSRKEHGPPVEQMGALIRAFDWSATPLGAMETWPERLKTLVELMLASPLLSTLACGPKRILLYNDLAAACYAERHPGALGRPLAESFPETYPSVASFYDRVFAGEAVCVPAQPLDLQDTGRAHVFDAYLSPVRGDDGRVAYAHMTGFEISDRLAAEAERDKQAAQLRESEERQAFLLRLSDAVRLLPDANAIQAVAADLLREHLGVMYVHYSENAGDSSGIAHGNGNGLPTTAGKCRTREFGKPRQNAHGCGQLQASSDAATDSLLSREEREELAAAHIGAYISAPLVKDGKWVATLTVHSAPPRDWQQAEIDLVLEVAERTRAAGERARAQTALAESEAKYRTLFNSIDEGFNTVEVIFGEQNQAVDVRIVEVNPAYAKLTGLPREAVVGRTLREIMPEVDQSVIERYGRAALTGEPMRFEEYLSTLDRWFDCYASRVGGEGSRFVTVVFNNITERKHNEGRQAYLLKLSDALRTLTDPLEIQEAAVRTLGQQLGADQTYYFEAQKKDGDVQIGPGYLTRDAAPLPRRLRLADFGDDAVASLHQGHTVVFQDTQQDERAGGTVRDAFQAIDTRAVVGVPLVKSGRLVAGLGVSQAHPRDWTSQDLEFLGETAERTWAAVERARAQAELRESQEQQRTLLEGIPQLVWRSHDFGRWTWASTQWMEFTGQSQEESLELGWLNALHSEDRESTRRAWTRAQETGFLDVEYRVRRVSDGEYRYHRTRARPLRDEQGQNLEWLGTSTDVEDLKQAEAAQRAAEEQLRLFVENVQEYAFVQTNPEGGITSWNPGAARLFGYSAEQMLGKDFSVLLTPEDYQDSVFRRELAVVTGGARNEDARWLLRQDGSRFWARWITEPVYDEAGRFQGLAKVLRDETDRQRAEQALRQSEAQLRRAIEVETIGVIFFKITGEITYSNDTFLRISGYTREDLERGLVRWDEMTPAEYMDSSLEAVQQFLSEGRVQPYEKEYVRKDGSRWWGMFVASRISDEIGVEFILDITERRRIGQALQSSLAEKEELLKEVHHRVKNNLQVIISLLNLQARQIQDEKVLSLFEETRNRVRSIASIHELLYRAESFASIQLTEYAQRLAPDLVSFYGLQNCVELVIEGNGATLELERAVPYGMLLNELISNACKHAFAGSPGGRLLISIQPEGNHIQLVVADTGPGLPAGFNYQKASSLGLKLVHALVRQLRGSVEFQSEGGTTVQVRFPATGLET